MDNLDNNTSKNNKNSNKESLEKTGRVAADGALMAATGGKSKKLERIPFVSHGLNRMKNKAGKRFAKLDDKTGGKLGDISKKANDSGLLDASQKGLDSLGGKSLSNNTSTSPSINNLPKNNFAKEGLNNNHPPLDRTNSQTKGIRDIFGRKSKKGGLTDILGNESSSSSETKGANFDFSFNFGVSKVVKLVILPFLPFLFIFLILFLIVVNSGNDNDLSAVDRSGNDGNDKISSNDITRYYAGGNKHVQEFYDMVLNISDEYKTKGKSVEPMYITGTYHIVRQYITGSSVAYFTDSKIREMYDGMLGNNTVYSKENYEKYLKDKFFKDLGVNSDEAEKYVEAIFTYINNYIDQKKDKTTCKKTTGSSCTYKFPGVHGRNVGEINLSNLYVRLMSSSDCHGTDNVSLNEELIPFEKYILGVGYGELGSYYNLEARKVHLIASRSFALTRPYFMSSSLGIKYVTENDKNILQLRSCVADQVYCSLEKGCSKDTPITIKYQDYVVYSGNKTHAYTYKEPLNDSQSSNLKSAWEETLGMVGVDGEGKIVHMGYANGAGNHDSSVWTSWAESGMDYVQIILSAYPEIKEIYKADCNNTSENTSSALLEVARRLWKKIANNNPEYYMNGLTVPPPDQYIDCSTFISWILYEYGYKEFGGVQHNTVAFLNTNWNQKFGWTEIPVGAGENVITKIQPGDILVRDNGSGGANGHINIVVKVENGKVYVFDTGSKSNWNTSAARNGEPLEKTSFFTSDYRSGKIIRVSNISGDSCETAETGEWSTWRQIAPAPWANIPLGNSGRTIGGYGCFVTSIAIQIARSNANTTISNFNPGTFVQALNQNKHGVSFSAGGAYQAPDSNISDIVPGFSTVGKYYLPEDKNEKIKTIQNYIDQGYYVILKVRYTGGPHWVAVTSTSSNGIKMVDPGSDATSVWDKYPVNESTEINVYKIG